jgi:lipoate---protein ligase
MRCLDLTLPTPAENLALDEALLEEAEAGQGLSETLRFWEPAGPMVVVGRSSKVSAEVHLPACRELGVPVLRRVSGGAAVVAGPGCLMYGLVLSFRLRPELRSIDRAHQFVLSKLAAAVERFVPGVRCRGTSDLTLGDRKVSGNSVRVRREHLLYHGTLLCGFPLEWIGRLLAMPPRQPDYRAARPHEAFVTNLPVSADDLRQAISAVWDANESRRDWPIQRTAELVAGKYGQAEWNG